MATTQIISTGVIGPVLSNGGAIRVTRSGSIGGGAEGVFAKNFSITTLSNKGSIGAASGALGGLAGVGGAAALGVDQLGPDDQPPNQRKRRHDQRRKRRRRRSGCTSGRVGGAGGSGVSNAGTITTLNNSGKITGGKGGAGVTGGAGGAGVSNGGTISDAVQ